MLCRIPAQAAGSGAYLPRLRFAAPLPSAPCAPASPARSLPRGPLQCPGLRMPLAVLCFVLF